MGEATTTPADKKPTAKRVVDAEIQALAAIDTVVSGLPDDATVARVMAWVISRYSPPGLIAFLATQGEKK